MARALLREGQIGDPDNLSEGEHDALVHGNLVTSGTLNFQDGTISGTGDVYANAFHGDGSTLSGVGGGNPESIYYNSTDAKATAITDGINVTGNINMDDNAGLQWDSGNTFEITHATSGISTIVNRYHGKGVRIQAENSGGTLQTVAKFGEDTDGAVELYYAGTKVIETRTDGILLPTGSDNIEIYEASNDLYIDNSSHGGRLRFYAEDSGGTNRTLAILGASGNYFSHLGQQTLFTRVGGFYIQNSSDQAYIALSTDVYYQNHVHGGRHIFKGEDTATANKTLMILDPDGAAELYYAGTKTLDTDSGGINVYDSDASDYLELQHNGSHVVLNNATDGGGLYFRTNGENQIVCNDDAGPALYYNNNIQLQTLGTGISIYNAGTSNYAQLTWSADNFYVVNPITSGQILLRGKQADTTVFNMLTVDPDGATELTYDGTKVLYTNANGLYFSEGGTAPGRLMIASNNLYLENQNHGGTLTLRGETGAGAGSDFLVADPANYLSLYHQNTETVRTQSGGIKIIGTVSGQDVLNVYWDSAAPKIYAQSTGEPLTISLDNASNVEKTVAVFDPDGAAELYYAGTKMVETADYGFSFGANTISGTGDIYCNDIYTASGTVYIGDSALSVSGTELLLDGEVVAGDRVVDGDTSVQAIDSSGQVEIKENSEISAIFRSDSVELPSDSFIYFGDTTTSGTWRMGVSGEDFVHQKYNGSTWDTKQTIVG